MTPNLIKLEKFITWAQVAKKYETAYEKFGFAEQDFSYEMTVFGNNNFRGQEVVYERKAKVWASGFGGGMVESNKELSRKVYRFLNTVLKIENKGFASFRGPENLRLGSFEYSYKQKGDVRDFYGEEFIWYQKRVIYVNHIVGGLIV